MNVDYIDISGWERQREPRVKVPDMPVRRPVKRSAARRRKKRRQRLLARMMFGGVVLLAGILLGVIFWRLLVTVTQRGGAESSTAIRQLTEAVTALEENDAAKPAIVEDFLTVNPYSRPGEALPEVRNIFVIIRRIRERRRSRTGAILRILGSREKPRPALILSSALTERSFSVFPWMKSVMR